MKRTLVEKLGDFVLGKGFYIVLFLCVATIGISGYYLIRSATADPAPDIEPVTGNPTVVLPDQSAAAPSLPSTHAPAGPEASHRQETAKPSQSAQAEAPKEEAPKEETPAPVSSPLDQAPAVYTWPVKGQIIHGYSLEVLAYDETMGDWRTHSGVDIAADEGFRVMAISDGTVQTLYQDDLMGNTVVVDHGNGLTSTYCNLADTLSVAPGDPVETGTVLGVVGSSAIAESARESHLHLEIAQNGVPVDPANYLPQ